MTQLVQLQGGVRAAVLQPQQLQAAVQPAVLQPQQLQAGSRAALAQVQATLQQLGGELCCSDSPRLKLQVSSGLALAGRWWGV